MVHGVSEIQIGGVEELGPKAVKGKGPWAVGNASAPGAPDADYFALSRRCRHLYADLGNGSIDSKGCLVCPWHGSKYEPSTGRMVRGPQGIFSKIPGLSQGFMALTRVLPLRRGTVERREDKIYVR
jgi:nitrite reductase/ring-hydroxylating ferredoxin subunit